MAQTATYNQPGRWPCFILRPKACWEQVTIDHPASSANTENVFSSFRMKDFLQVFIALLVPTFYLSSFARRVSVYTQHTFLKFTLKTAFPINWSILSDSPFLQCSIINKLPELSEFQTLPKYYYTKSMLTVYISPQNAALTQHVDAIKK